jgi:hypothetical protein
LRQASGHGGIRAYGERVLTHPAQRAASHVVVRIDSTDADVYTATFRARAFNAELEEELLRDIRR